MGAGFLISERPNAAAGRLLCAALACLLPFAFCAQAISAKAPSLQSAPQPVEEETHHGSVVKESRVVISSRLKAPQHRPLTLTSAGARLAYAPTRELRSDLAKRWDAHSDRRRGPPPSSLLS
ncbi:MAG: hypothetical protein JOZ96_12840 [Acidobacteria bacterium]|nr:hypothetical protein [Acidobacteriota bacterium]